MTVARAFVDLNPARTRLRVATLDQWAMAGLALAETLVAEGGRSLADIARTLYRISQAVRLAIVLATRLSDPDDPGFPTSPTKARPARADEVAACAETVKRRDKPDEKPARQLRLGFGDQAFADDAIRRRPLKDIIKVICRARGVTPDWSLWSDEDDAPAAANAAPEPDRPAAAPPDPGRSIPRPRPRPPCILDRPERPPPAGRLRTRLMSASATGALIPTFPPLAPRRADAAARPDADPRRPPRLRPSRPRPKTLGAPDSG